MSLVKVENELGLYKDLATKAVINTDNIARENYLQRRSKLMAEKEAIKQNTQDITELKNEVQEVKNLLQQILKAVQN